MTYVVQEITTTQHWLEPTKDRTEPHLARVWTWEFASRIATAVSAIIRQHHRTHQTKAYVGSSSSSDRQAPPPEEGSQKKKPRSDPSVWKCPACRQNAHTDHKKHLRNKDCKWGSENTPEYIPRVWSCPACQAELPRQSTNPKTHYETG